MSLSCLNGSPWKGEQEWNQGNELEGSCSYIIMQASKDWGSDQIVTMESVRNDQILDICSEHRATGLSGRAVLERGKSRMTLRLINLN